MLFLLMFVCIIVIGLLFVIYGGFEGETFGWIAIVVGALALGVAVIAIPFERTSVHARLARMEAVELTAQAGRIAGDEYEGAMFRKEISDMNAWLAEGKYYRTTTFWIYWPAAIEDAEAIQ